MEFPRSFSGEQSYWTILGLDGGTEQGLINTDGAIEATKFGFSIEPFVVMDGNRLLRWSDVSSQQSLQEGVFADSACGVASRSGQFAGDCIRARDT
ncbi:hypothetical protein M233_02570 [Xylella fastidiosa subsp. multiplex Griffin-1]|nr:hypothetical protein M233_02570 [Xylella fastidiosa subsp. multiplex Griffin-1]